MELKKHVVKGMAWTFAEKALTAVFQMFVGLVLMNFLFPDDYGTIQILVVFTSVCSVFVDSGFSAALIRRKEVGQAEYSAVFFFNIFTACQNVLTVPFCAPVIFFCVEWIAPRLISTGLFGCRDENITIVPHFAVQSSACNAIAGNSCRVKYDLCSKSVCQPLHFFCHNQPWSDR